jgi:2-polyprenyl-6-methoxyphenol hydroxylase-like FAD-dependent oxidoreductase
MQQQGNYTIIGAGIAGLTIALALTQKGITTTLFEAAPEIKTAGAGIVLAANAMRVYRLMGIDQAIMALGRQLSGFDILSDKGKLISAADTSFLHDGVPDNFTIHRAALHQVLLGQLPSGTVQTGKRLSSFEQQGKQLLLHFEDGSTHTTDYLIAADGIHSPVRRQLLPASAPRYAGYTCWRAVIDAPGFAGKGSTETWGTAGRFGIAPLAGDQVYWFACINAPQQDARMRAFTVADLRRTFAAYHSDITGLLDRTPDEALIWGDIMDIAPLPKLAFGNIVLAGDAGHATTPNMGQGACQGIEDAWVLAEELARQADVPKAFAAYEQRRLQRVHYITNNSRLLGHIGQMEQPLLCRLRNTLLRCTPEAFKRQQVRKALQTDF